MRHGKVWLLGGAALALVWAVALTGRALARAHRMTAERITAFVQMHPLAGRSAVERRRLIADLADRVNRLELDERRRARFDRSSRAFYAQMTDAERGYYLDLTLPQGVQQMMRAFNDMPPEKRKKVVKSAVADLRRWQQEGGADQPELDRALADTNLQKIVNVGLKSYLSDASASAKLDLQPLIEQLQEVLRR